MILVTVPFSSQEFMLFVDYNTTCKLSREVGQFQSVFSYHR
jgi:hypothetical protein